MLTRVFLIVLGLTMIGASSATQQFAAAQTEDGTKQPMAAEMQNAEQKKFSGAPKLSGRLPRFYSAVVRPGQRQTIYQIQASYRLEIEKLQMQLEELKRRESVEIAQVLSDEQRSRVAQLANSSSRAAMKSSTSNSSTTEQTDTEQAGPEQANTESTVTESTVTESTATESTVTESTTAEQTKP